MKFAIRLILVMFPGYLQAAVVILNGLSHTHTLTNAQGKAQGVIRVRNEAAKESRILVYRHDLISQCGQPSQYPEKGTHNRSLGDGLTTNVNEKIVGASEEYEVRYSIELEKNKTEPGTYWQVVMIEVAEPIREESKRGVIVNSTVRYAIQVIVNVGTYEGPQLSYENVVFDNAAAGQYMLKVVLKNNGGFGSRANMVLEIYDTAGNLLKTTKPTTRMLYPGNCNTFEIPVTDLAKGKYECVIIADTGKDLFGSNITLQVE